LFLVINVLFLYLLILSVFAFLCVQLKSLTLTVKVTLYGVWNATKIELCLYVRYEPETKSN